MKPFSDIPDDLSQLDNYLSTRESTYPLKPGTDAQIIWHSDTPQKTKYSIVYLHGFRASHPEGNPVHRTVAEAFGCNLFLSRMAEHGIKSERPLLQLTEEKLLQSARYAMEMGSRIGEKVILMGTSTGASLALYLAAQAQFQKIISALVLYSPLIRFYGLKEKLLMSAFGRKCLEFIPGKTFMVQTPAMTYAEERIWNSTYALQGALALGSFINHYMHRDLFEKVNCPTFVGYYYKNQKEHDKVVSVPAIKAMIPHLRSRTQFVDSVNFREASNHVICSSLVSKSVDKVISKTELFLKNLVSHTAREN